MQNLARFRTKFGGEYLRNG